MCICCNEEEIMTCFRDTTELAVKKQVNNLQVIANIYENSTRLTNRIEFWDWMDRNFNGVSGHMFSSNQSMKTYIAGGTGKADWLYKQLQGKGYEWDWMQKQRSSFKNIFKVYNAGDVSNQAAIDVTEYDVLTGKSAEYQMKAYISKNNPDLHNTDKNVGIVTNTEKAENIRNNGYTVEKFKSREEIIDDVNSRMKEIDNGSATPKYTVKNVGGAMIKSGLVGCVFSMGTETIALYNQWRNHQLSDDEYLNEILKAGGDAGVTAAMTTGVMVPVSAQITVAGVTSLVNIPVAFAISNGINKIIAPCFGRGEYKKILGQAYYYSSLEKCYYSFMKKIDIASQEYKTFINEFIEQDKKYKRIQGKERFVDQQLKSLFDSI